MIQNNEPTQKLLALITSEEEEKVEPFEAEVGRSVAPAVERRQRLLAYGLILVGVFLFVQEMIPFWLSDSQLLAVILVLIGAALLLKRKESSN